MIDILLQIGIAKLLVSCVLAGLALVVQWRVVHPAFIHRFWLLVLVALLLPAVVAIPVLPREGVAAAVGVDGVVLAADGTARIPANATNGPRTESGTPLAARITDDTKAGLVITWLLGTALLLAWTLLRVLRFRHWLVRSSQPAPPELRDEVSAIGRRLGLVRTPTVHTTSARVSPMVCWAGGRVRIVVPSFLLSSLDRHELRAMLAHELAHVRRRDHLVRWIERIACSAFWWNPVAWWARREVRAAEEASCDVLGAAVLRCAPRDYAKSLLRVVELLSRPPTPPVPAFASGAASSRSPQALERRIRMLTSGESTVHSPQWIRRAGTVAAVCMVPLGLVYCRFADQPMPTAPEEPAELVTPSEEPADKQQTRVVFTYNMTSDGALSLAPRAYDVFPTCSWVYELDSDGRKQEPRKDCVYSWQEWHSRLKEARAEPGGIMLIRVSPRATAGQVWQLQGRILANR
ncbi:MAG: M56 family metallopeptidase [Gemmatimonadota bacterium]|nr:M56 family metallopeptidase [Gemmatimonadota bacterium]